AFSLVLSNPTNATLADATGIGTILGRTLPPPAPPVINPGVAVAYTTASQWSTGFVGNVSIRNTGTSAINGWTIEFDLAADISNIWGAEIVSRVGNRYTLRAASWNRTIGVNQSISFGFQTATPFIAPPVGFKFNGVSL
ncbi:MAG: cellulose binding domain-containing protein, partial [Gemmataceae bacterium]